jgi:cysteinyl-tRNA synthetase
MFGLGEGPPAEIGWGTPRQGEVEGTVDVSNLSNRHCEKATMLITEAQREEILMPYLRALSAFRDEVRSKAIEKAPLTDFLKLSDRLRDEDLIPLGVALDDQEGKLFFISITLCESTNLS